MTDLMPCPADRGGIRADIVAMPDDARRASVHGLNALMAATQTQPVPLPWSAYVGRLPVKRLQAWTFYETEARRTGRDGNAGGGQ